MIAKSISIEGTGCKSGGCVRKAVELTSGDLSLVRDTGLRIEQSVPTGRQKSAEGVLGPVHTKRSASTMSANDKNAMNTTSSFSKRENMRRKPLSLRKRRSISLRFL